MSYATVPPLPAPVRKVGAPLAAIVALGTVAALLLSLITAVNPAGTVTGFVLSSAAMAGVLLCYLWLDRWEPEPPRLLVLAFLWGASVAVVLSVAFEHLLSMSLAGAGEGAHKPSLVTAAVGAPLVEEAAVPGVGEGPVDPRTQIGLVGGSRGSHADRRFSRGAASRGRPDGDAREDDRRQLRPARQPAAARVNRRGERSVEGGHGDGQGPCRQGRAEKSRWLTASVPP